MSRYIVDSVSNGTIVYFIIRDTSNNSIVPLPTKYLKFKKNLGRKKKTLKNIALKLTWYLNYLEDNKLTVNKVLELSAFEQQEHFTSYLHFIRAGSRPAAENCRRHPARGNRSSVGHRIDAFCHAADYGHTPLRQANGNAPGCLAPILRRGPRANDGHAWLLQSIQISYII